MPRIRKVFYKILVACIRLLSHCRYLFTAKPDHIWGPWGLAPGGASHIWMRPFKKVGKRKRNKKGEKDEKRASELRKRVIDRQIDRQTDRQTDP